VLGVCRRVLRNAADAEDAAQAAFLMLARHAGRRRRFRSIAAWLHRVARNVALDMLSSRKTRDKHESEAAAMTRLAVQPAGLSDEQAAPLHEEINALPDNYRQAVILCYLEEKSMEQAAAVMACPVSSVGTWASRGRERLKSRLARRGLVMSLAALTSLLSAEAGAAELPVSFVTSTTAAAARFVAGSVVAGAGAGAQLARSALVAEGVLKQMYYAKLRLISLLVAVLLCVAGGSGWLISHAAGAEGNIDRPLPMPVVEPPALADAPPDSPELDKPIATLADAELEAVVKGNSEFACDMYKQLSKEHAGKNLFISPFSISSALAMTAEGARGETAEQMGAVLRFPPAARLGGEGARRLPWKTEFVHAGMSALNNSLKGGKDKDEVAAARAEVARLRKAFEAAEARTTELRKKGFRQRNAWKAYRAATAAQEEAAAQLRKASEQVDQYELTVANALWGEKTYPFERPFTATINRYYKTGGVFPSDFRNNFAAERLRINAWVEEQTKNRIKDLIKQGDLTRFTRLVLTNAIFFKGEWSKPFEEANTKPGDFTLADGETVQTPMMNAMDLDVGKYAAFNADGSLFDTPRMQKRGGGGNNYPGKGGFSVLELPYKGGALSMVLLAPNDPSGLAAVEQRLTPERLSAWLGKLVKRDVNVFLPKFKLETDYTLGDTDEPATLQHMGMVQAFVDPRRPDGADFTGMRNTNNRMARLYITKVLHKAFLEVNEKGTEAAGATAVIMAVPTGAPVSVPFTPTFKADRPFVFLIRDIKSGSILFMGRMMNPHS
jgi:RNA polymerase sigma factor (sigma-70 family)